MGSVTGGTPRLVVPEPAYRHGEPLSFDGLVHPGYPIEAGAVDGFNVLSAVQPAQFEAFALGVVPELQRRGVFPTEYEGSTLREHLGLPRPDNVHVAHGDVRLQPVTGRDGSRRRAVERSARHP